jgi:hypothetical protein
MPGAQPLTPPAAPGPQTAVLPGAGPSTPPGGPQTANQPPPAPAAVDPNKDQQGEQGIQGLDMVGLEAQSKRALQDVARQIRDANPGKKWKPDEFLATVEAYISESEKLNPIEKIYAQAQLAGANATYKYWNASLQAEMKERGQDIQRDRVAAYRENTQMAWRRAKLSADTALQRQAMSDATRITAEQMAQAGANDRADILDAYHRDALDAGIDKGNADRQLRLELGNLGIQEKEQDSIFGSEARGGIPATPPAPIGQAGGPAPVPKPVRRPLGSTGAVGGAPSAPQKGEVRKGYRYKGGPPSDPNSWVKVAA